MNPVFSNPGIGQGKQHNSNTINEAHYGKLYECWRNR
jgi:hypothetical protein